jgi:hypothetical protein
VPIIVRSAQKYGCDMMIKMANDGESPYEWSLDRSVDDHVMKSLRRREAV